MPELPPVEIETRALFVTIPGPPTQHQLTEIFRTLAGLKADTRDVLIRDFLNHDIGMRFAYFARDFVSKANIKGTSVDADDIKTAFHLIATAIRTHAPADAIEIACTIAAAL